VNILPENIRMKWGPKTRDIFKLLFCGNNFFCTSLISGGKNGNYAGGGDEAKFV